MRRTFAAPVIALVASLTAAGCGGGNAGGDKAGGDGTPIVLKMADIYPDFTYVPAVLYFAKRVEEISDGALRIESVDMWDDFDPGTEQRAVRDVAAGKADLGWVGTRVFDTLGVDSFQALTAPGHAIRGERVAARRHLPLDAHQAGRA
jgi:TRAP-type C4-dicarboxylate transport system substrate-binding protein